MPIGRLLFLLLAGFLLTACQRGPDEGALRERLQDRLDSEFRSGLFQVESFRRAGSAPFTDPATADQRLTVFFNAQLRFLQDYNLAAWESLHAASLSYLLGATEKGIRGVKAEGNTEGDVLQVHGTSTFVLRSGQWQPLAYARSGVQARAGIPPAGARQLVEELSGILDATAGRRGGEEIQVVENELQSTVRRINLQLDKFKKIYAVASGPREGAYFRHVQAFEDYLQDKPVKVKNYDTEGSVENCSLVQKRAVDIAVTQSNIAALAFEGEGPFKATGPLRDLRAMASLHPELLHVIVSEASRIATVADLKGRRIDIGLPQSGSRVDALRIIDALGLRLSDFSSVREEGLARAATALQAGEIDAIFTTIEAPARALQNLAAVHPVRILPLPDSVVEALTGEYGTYLRLEIPQRTYPRQETSVVTLGLTAMLIAHAAMPDDRALEFLATIFGSVDAVARQNARAALLSRQTARTGISLPLHPAADSFYNSGDEDPRIVSD